MRRKVEKDLRKEKRRSSRLNCPSESKEYERYKRDR